MNDTHIYTAEQVFDQLALNAYDSNPELCQKVALALQNAILKNHAQTKIEIRLPKPCTQKQAMEVALYLFYGLGYKAKTQLNYPTIIEVETDFTPSKGAMRTYINLNDK